MRVAGIDYGSKHAGTTVVAGFNGSSITLVQSAKKEDADLFILKWARQYHPAFIFLDAPLSLPGKYRYPDHYEDYFYRKADRALGAMSPMFLGGLSARAMQLAEQLRAMNIEVWEAYPAYLAKILELGPERYKKREEDIPAIRQQLEAHLPEGCCPERVSSWHQIDALLALITGLRYSRKEHLTFGQVEEGLIIV
ncbi:MAG: DUF429 domain-containing protein [Phaeodactylibacter sp.]|nr:DUF429 domain-containing protein [Phaeodactylibacter sp.]MCB9303455.1 DUF429 domain-containing protein [Lewinellaceae bacterium]